MVKYNTFLWSSSVITTLDILYFNNRKEKGEIEDSMMWGRFTYGISSPNLYC